MERSSAKERCGCGGENQRRMRRSRGRKRRSARCDDRRRRANALVPRRPEAPAETLYRAPPSSSRREQGCAGAGLGAHPPAAGAPMASSTCSGHPEISSRSIPRGFKGFQGFQGCPNVFPRAGGGDEDAGAAMATQARDGVAEARGDQCGDDGERRRATTALAL
eukprot:gene14001-biopygen13005